MKSQLTHKIPKVVGRSHSLCEIEGTRSVSGSSCEAVAHGRLAQLHLMYIRNFIIYCTNT